MKIDIENIFKAMNKKELIKIAKKNMGGVFKDHPEIPIRIKGSIAKRMIPLTIDEIFRKLKIFDEYQKYKSKKFEEFENQRGDF